MLRFSHCIELPGNALNYPNSRVGNYLFGPLWPWFWAPKALFCILSTVLDNKMRSFSHFIVDRGARTRFILILSIARAPFRQFLTHKSTSLSMHRIELIDPSADSAMHRWIDALKNTWPDTALITTIHSSSNILMFQVVDQKSPSSDWVYWASVIILGLAMSVRAFQILYVATTKSTKSSGEDDASINAP